MLWGVILMHTSTWKSGQNCTHFGNVVFKYIFPTKYVVILIKFINVWNISSLATIKSAVWPQHNVGRVYLSINNRLVDFQYIYTLTNAAIQLLGRYMVWTNWSIWATYLASFPATFKWSRKWYHVMLPLIPWIKWSVVAPLLTWIKFNRTVFYELWTYKMWDKLLTLHKFHLLHHWRLDANKIFHSTMPKYGIKCEI